MLAADEVYQENVYGDAPAFISFKKIVHDLKSTIPVVSFHSVSKGFTGECGLRGGYFEMVNVDAEVRAPLLKLASISLCSNTVGQLATGLMVRPPAKGAVLGQGRLAPARDRGQAPAGPAAVRPEEVWRGCDGLARRVDESARHPEPTN